MIGPWYTQVSQELPEVPSHPPTGHRHQLRDSIVCPHHPPLRARESHQEGRIDTLDTRSHLSIRLPHSQPQARPQARRPSGLLLTLSSHGIDQPEVTRTSITSYRSRQELHRCTATKMRLL